jgi:nicotinamidase-related amidase
MKGTPGQKKIPETALRDPLVIEPEPLDPSRLTERLRGHQGDVLLHKHWFDVFTNENVETVIAALRPRTIVLYGVATDVCNRYAIEGLIARHPEVRLFAVTDAMKAIDPDAQEHLLRQWAEEGVRMIQTDELVEDGIPA